MAEPFDALQDDFLRITTDIVYASATTVGPDGRPRSRMWHPVWEVVDGVPHGAVITDRTPLKQRHLAANPHVSLTYWSPKHDTVYVDCTARWAEGDVEKQAVWDLVSRTPEPLGFDPEPPYGDIHHEVFHPLWLEPYRVGVFRAEQLPAQQWSPHFWEA
jgi:uncharacterized pyridoxamine 5'-phosphate oxidase family protein